MAKNTGISYEKLVQHLFSLMLNEKSVKTIDVKQNVTLQGKTTTHQIDVYWEFEMGGIIYKTIVQAKDYNSTVSQDKLLTFAAVLNDLPGQPRGIFITKTGYQKGAKKIAEANGILLYEFRQPTDNDWKGRIKDIKIEMQCIAPDFSNQHSVVDNIWFIQKCKELNIQPPQHLPSGGGLNTEILLYDENDNVITSLYHLQNQCYENYTTSDKNYRITHKFDTPTFIASNYPPMPKIKLSEFSFDVSVHELIDTVEIYGDTIVAFILKNIFDGTTETLGHDLKIRKPENLIN